MTRRSSFLPRAAAQIDVLDIIFGIAVVVVCVGYYYLAPMASRFPAPAMAHPSASTKFSVAIPSAPLIGADGCLQKACAPRESFAK